MAQQQWCVFVELTGVAAGALGQLWMCLQAFMFWLSISQHWPCANLFVCIICCAHTGDRCWVEHSRQEPATPAGAVPQLLQAGGRCWSARAWGAADAAAAGAGPLQHTLCVGRSCRAHCQVRFEGQCQCMGSAWWASSCAGAPAWWLQCTSCHESASDCCRVACVYLYCSQPLCAAPFSLFTVLLMQVQSFAGPLVHRPQHQRAQPHPSTEQRHGLHLQQRQQQVPPNQLGVCSSHTGSRISQQGADAPGGVV